MYFMEQHPDLQEPGFIGDEAEVTPRIRVLRALARMIARDLLNRRHDDKEHNNTMTGDLRNRVKHD
jgi:hypothetical protein